MLITLSCLTYANFIGTRQIEVGDETRCVQVGEHRACEIPKSQCVPITFDNYLNTEHSEISISDRKHSSALRQKDAGFGGFMADYYGNFTRDQRHAIDYCLEEATFWWPSTIPVNVIVNFSAMEGHNLGYAQPTSLWSINSTLYPIALLKAMTAHDFNRTTAADVYMNLNSDIKWFTSSLITDSPDSSEYDLISVCFHELLHGLFMSGGNIKINRVGTEINSSNNINGINGSYVDSGTNGYLATFCNPDYTGRFDAFLSNEKGCSIVEAYKNSPQWLGDSVTNNNLWFATSNGTRIAKLHAPRPFIEGTSIYHLSLGTYEDKAGSNDLMQPAMGKGYRQHEIGNVMREIIGVMLNESESHAKYCEDAGRPVVDQTTIEGGSGEKDGSGRPDGVDADEGGNSNSENESGKKPSSGESSGGGGFAISVGSTSISGWLIVGIAVGLIITIVLSAFAVRAVIYSKLNDKVPPRRVARTDRIELSAHGNAADVI